MRVIANQIDRARWRNTLIFQFLPTLSAGIEYNPLAEKISPLANWVAVTETKNRAALILGTSSDRIGTPSGQSFYATVSKDLEAQTNLPLAPYAGLAYGTYEEKFHGIGGLNLRFPLNLSALIIYDGVKVHPTASWAYRNFVFSFLLAQGKNPGASASVAF
jgi:hypothetical protein